MAYHDQPSRTETPRLVGAAHEPVRVVIAEGQGLVRAAFRILLENHPGVAVAAEAGTVEDAVAATLRAKPDVVLLDHDLPGGDALQAARRILADAAPAGPRILVLLAREHDDALFGALRAGAAGLLIKDADPDDLLRAVRLVAAGQAVLAPGMARRLVAEFLSHPERLQSSASQLEELTAREREVVALVACGLSNEEIAQRLVVTRATAKTHVSRALCKLRARDRAQLVVMAYESGLVRPGPRWTERAQPPARPAAALGHRHLRPVAA